MDTLDIWEKTTIINIAVNPRLARQTVSFENDMHLNHSIDSCLSLFAACRHCWP